MEKIDGLDCNNELESETYPIDIPMIVGAAIKAQRCPKCNKVYFTNKGKDWTICRKCDPTYNL